jgi:hypothetical protein
MTAVAAMAPSDAVKAPAGFSLAAHAASREAWELGDGDAVAVRLAVAPHVDAAALPGAVPIPRRGRATSRTTPRSRASAQAMTIQVRRLEPFLRWVLAFGGDVRPTAPREVVDAFRALARRTVAVYEGAP